MSSKSNHKKGRPLPAGRDGQKFRKPCRVGWHDGQKFSEVGREAGRDALLKIFHRVEAGKYGRFAQNYKKIE